MISFIAVFARKMLWLSSVIEIIVDANGKWLVFDTYVESE